MSTVTATEAAPNFTNLAQRTNTKAILALVFGFLFWPAAIVLGHLAHREIADTGESGRGLATAGLVLGYIGLGFAVLFFFGLMAAASQAAAIGVIR
jgi:Domain of unknown function (DUF4190)